MVMACKHLQTSEIASNSNTHLVAISCNKLQTNEKVKNFIVSIITARILFCIHIVNRTKRHLFSIYRNDAPFRWCIRIHIWHTVCIVRFTCVHNFASQIHQIMLQGKPRPPSCQERQQLTLVYPLLMMKIMNVLNGLLLN